MQPTYQTTIPLTPVGAILGHGGPPFENNEQPNSLGGSVSKVLLTAKKDRERATAALQSVNKALREPASAHEITFAAGNAGNNHNILTTPFMRVSPGHFLLSSRAHTGALAPTPTTIPPSTTMPPRRTTSSSPSSLALVENLAAALLPHANTPFSGTSRFSRGFAFNETTPGNNAQNITTPGDNSYAVTPARGNIIIRNNPNSSGSGGPASMSKRLAELQRYHFQLLTECQEAENKAAHAKEEKKIAHAEVKQATRKLQELEVAIKKHTEELAAQQAQQEAVAINIDLLQLTKDQVEKSSGELADLQSQVEDATTTLAELTTQLRDHQTRLEKSQEQHAALQDTQARLSEATAQLESILSQQALAEQNLLEAESRCATVTATLEDLEVRVATRIENATTADALIAEAEVIVEDREERAAEAQRKWQEAEEELAILEAALIETSARLETKREIISEAEYKCEVMKRQMRRAEADTATATAAAEAAGHELTVLQSRVKSARETESAALARAEEAEMRAGIACRLAEEEESRAVAAKNALEEILARCDGADAAEKRLLEIRAEVGEGEAIASLREQLNALMKENSALQEELAKAREANAASVAKAQQAQQGEKEMESRLQATLAEAESMVLMHEVQVDALQQAEIEALAALEDAEVRVDDADQALSEAIHEVEQLKHSHSSIAKAKLLEFELTDVRAQLNRACEAAEKASNRADAAENKIKSLENQVAKAIEEKEFLEIRATAMTAARDVAVAEISQLKKEAAHHDAGHAELSTDITRLTSVIRSLKQERNKTEAFAATLQLQVESLQGQIRLENGRKLALMASSSTTTSTSAGNRTAGKNGTTTTTEYDGSINTSNAYQKGRNFADQAELVRQVDRLMGQNSTLKATATRLSRALAAALQQQKKENNGGTYSTGGDGISDGDEMEWGLIPAMRTRKNNGQLEERGASGSGELKLVLEQLEAVEELLENASSC